MLSDYNGIKVERNNKRQLGNCPNIWKLNNTLLYNSWVKERLERNLKNKLH